MKNVIGILQGRLSPPLKGRLQAFPVETWEEEFPKARRCGFDALEWVFEADGHRKNPLWTREGIKRIRTVSEVHGVAVPSICADYFMRYPFFRTSPEAQSNSIQTLRHLIEQGARLGIRRVLLPVLEEVEIQTETDQRQLIQCLRAVLPIAETHGIELAIESNLPVESYEALMEAFDHPLIRIYYDIGNRVATGHRPETEIPKLGTWISGVHVKDRKRGGSTVPLGTGDVDFTGTFQALQAAGFEGPYILQGARDGIEEETARRYLEFVKRHLQESCKYAEQNP